MNVMRRPQNLLGFPICQSLYGQQMAWFYRLTGLLSPDIRGYSEATEPKETYYEKEKIISAW